MKLFFLYRKNGQDIFFAKNIRIITKILFIHLQALTWDDFALRFYKTCNSSLVKDLFSDFLKSFSDGLKIKVSLHIYISSI